MFFGQALIFTKKNLSWGGEKLFRFFSGCAYNSNCQPYRSQKNIQFFIIWLLEKRILYVCDALLFQSPSTEILLNFRDYQNFNFQNKTSVGVVRVRAEVSSGPGDPNVLRLAIASRLEPRAEKGCPGAESSRVWRNAQFWLSDDSVARFWLADDSVDVMFVFAESREGSSSHVLR